MRPDCFYAEGPLCLHGRTVEVQCAALLFFLGKVPPIGGFCRPTHFLPPTLLRGGIYAFCPFASFQRNGPVSDFISCSGLYRRKGIFHRCVDENTFRTDLPIWCFCCAMSSYRILFTLSQLSSVALYHTPRGIRRSSCTTAHIFLHAVGGVTHRIAASGSFSRCRLSMCCFRRESASLGAWFFSFAFGVSMPGLIFSPAWRQSSPGRVDIRRYSSVFLGSSLAKGTMAPPTLISP